ncbi:MAG: hypothetical protein H6841_10335 [Planctomycetes bacterium]|nr:hypothetical protein [Planctomycetota bacterium]MCB9936574.1 hypothetical protein [Planctomycetota bacterium]
MPKKTGLIVMLMGVAIIIAALVDLFGMSQGFNLDFGGIVNLNKWPTERIALLAIGVLLGVWGAYSLSRKGKKKK